MSEFERNIRDQLRARELNLGSDCLNELKAGREFAVAKNQGFRFPRVLWPLGGMTLASLAIFFTVLSPLPTTQDRIQEPLALDSLDTRDLDFYYWLAKTQNAEI